MKKAYAEGKNVTVSLREQLNLDKNTPEIIELAYDLQAGTYINRYEKDKTQDLLFASEVGDLFKSHISSTDSLLDIGTGEMSVLSLIYENLPVKPKQIYAFDISWSRIYKGLKFLKKIMGESHKKVTPFVADIAKIPLLNKSINVTMSTYALEPNGGNLKELLRELFRVTKDKLLLCEPCYEINSEEGKQRMDKLGYIKNIDGVVGELGGRVIEQIKINNVFNPLNPSVCFVVLPPASSTKGEDNTGLPSIYSIPGTNHPLKYVDNFLFSDRLGYCFPILKSIPILKADKSILATALEY